MKKFISLVILMSMTLHCVSRLGFLTWIYQNRQTIAYTVGFFEDRPITMCGNEYDLDRAIKLEVSHDETDKIPAPILPVSEINLFFDFSASIQKEFERSLLAEVYNCIYLLGNFSNPKDSIFQPPRV